MNAFDEFKKDMAKNALDFLIKIENASDLGLITYLEQHKMLNATYHLIDEMLAVAGLKRLDYKASDE